MTGEQIIWDSRLFEINIVSKLYLKYLLDHCRYKKLVLFLRGMGLN